MIFSLLSIKHTKLTAETPLNMSCMLAHLSTIWQTGAWTAKKFLSMDLASMEEIRGSQAPVVNGRCRLSV